MTKISNEGSFSISVVGDRTKTTYTGEFKAFVVLSYNAEILRDKLFREALGAYPESANPRVRDLAEFFADFDVSFTQTPMFWKSSGNGRQLNGDDNVLAEIYKSLQDLRTAALNTEETVTADKDKISKAVAEQDK